jgi:acetyl-CoA acyltransferase 2
MPQLEKEIVILSAARTPFGKFCGALKDLSATELGIIAGRAAIEKAGISPADIGHVIFGNAQQTSADAIYLARHIGLKIGVPASVPTLTVNRICGSGCQSIVSGAQLLLLGEASFILAGGTENMTQAPHVIRGARSGIPLGEGRLEDSLWCSQ